MATKFKNLTDLGGLVTNTPADKIPDRNASDVANIDFSSTGLIQTKKGYRVFGNEEAGVGTNTRAFLYKKNYGTASRIMLRVREDGSNGTLEWFNASHPDNDDGQWEELVGSLTLGALMGFAPFNSSTILTQTNTLYFCNGVENYSSWNGATATVASVTSNTIVVNETIADEGFDSATGDLTIDGTSYAYTGITASTFTGVTPDPTTQNPSAGVGVAQKADTTSMASEPKGNVLLTAGARVWQAGVSDAESTVYYSKVADGSTWTSGANPADPGLEDFPDGGGTINLLDSKDNNQVVIHKDDAILLFKFEYTDTAKIAYLQTLTSTDDSGCTNQKAGTGSNQVSFFATGVEGIKQLARAVDGDNLNMGSVTDIILPTIEDYDFSDASMIYFPKKRAIYLACKSSSDENYNDKIITYYLNKGDISIDDGFVADWIVDGKDLYAFSSIDQRVFKHFDRYSANGQGLNHIWASSEETYDAPALLKEMDTVYIEGFIRANTKLKVSVQYGIFGSGGEKTKIIAWDDEFVSSQKLSALGVDVLGMNSLGASSDDILDSYPFSVGIHVDALTKGTRYKIKLQTEYDDETVEESYWAVSNISTNPRMKGINKLNMINTNA